MKRRDLLGRMGTLVAVSGAGLSSSGCLHQFLGLQGVLDIQKMSADEVLKLFAQVEHKIQNYSLNQANPTPRSVDGTALFKELMSSLWLME